ncbi:MAG: hypothetical protein ACO3F2_01020 [Roseiflexaceae bacterium]|jgi:hypothetical protein
MTRRTMHIIAIVGCVCALVAWILLQPPRYTSFPDAIRGDLRQRGYAVDRVELLHMWPDTVNTLSFGANVRIIMVSGSEHWGRLDCKIGRRDCVYYLPMAKVFQQELPDLVRVRSWREEVQIWGAQALSRLGLR